MKWWSKLLRRSKVVCAECIGYPWEDMNTPPTHLDVIRHEKFPCQHIPFIEHFDHITGRKWKTRVDCRDANADGYCPHFIKASLE